MKNITKTLVAGLVLVAGVAFAADATDPTVKAWQELMGGQGAAMKTLGGMAEGKMAFDAAAAEAAKAALVASSVEIPAKFMTEAADPASKASANIWADWDAFVVNAAALDTAAMALDASSLESLQAGIGAVGGACGTCHKANKL